MQSCHSSKTPVIAKAVAVAITINPPAIVNNVRFFLSNLSESIPANGDISKNGSIEANVNNPTRPDLSESARTYHWLAIKNVQALAPPRAFEAHAYL